MRAISSLFRGSPFAPLQEHMEIVVKCVHKLTDVYQAYSKNDFDTIEQLAVEISKMEHEADLTKNEIRNNLPKGIFLAINRGDLLDMLSLQDTIADKAEDVATLLTLKKIRPLPDMADELKAFVDKNIETVEYTHKILKQLNELIESSFGGKEAELVVQMVERVAFLEHEADIFQAALLKKLFALEDEVSFTTFYLWVNIFKTTASLSNISEKLANKVRMLLELK